MPIVDRYKDKADEQVLASSRRFSPITPSNSTDLAEVPKALYVSVGGTLACYAADDDSDTSVSFGTVPTGTVLPIRPRRVLSTGTGATVIGLY